MSAKHYSTSAKGIGGQIKRRYADFIVEEKTLEGKKCEVKRFASDEEIQRDKCEIAIPENSEGKEHLHLELEKINKDLNFIIRDLTRYLRCSKKRIGYAGLKDKRAVTCQKISIFDPDVGKLKVFGRSGIELRNLEWADDRINIGNLQGNYFTITIRDLSLEKQQLETEIKKCFSEMGNGIANYFGEQRFGGIRQITHLVGREFINGNFKNGVMLYLTSTCPEEHEEIRTARLNLAKTNDFSQATKEFPKEQRYERSMIHHLCKYPNDYVGAFGKLPKAIRYLFTHAYQSYLYNKIIDKRIEKYGELKEIKGDVLSNGIPTVPLIGFETELSGKEAGEIEKLILDEEGMSPDDFKIKQMPEISSKGNKREIILYPEELKLIEIAEDEFYTGKLKAKISFYLSKGNYATVVLRELMKNPA